MGLTACGVAEEPLTAALNDAGVAKAVVEAGEPCVHRASITVSDGSDVTVIAGITLVADQFTADTICGSIRAIADTTPFDFEYLDTYLEVAGKGDIVHINPYYESFGWPQISPRSRTTTRGQLPISASQPSGAARAADQYSSPPLGRG